MKSNREIFIFNISLSLPIHPLANLQKNTRKRINDEWTLQKYITANKTIQKNYFKIIFKFHSWEIWLKVLSLCHKLWFSNLFIFATHYCRTYIFQTMNSVRSINLSLKYQRFRPSGCKDTDIRKFEFVAKTLLLLV